MKQCLLFTAICLATMFGNQGHAEWQVVNFVDEFGEHTGDKGVRTTGNFPAARACRFTIQSADFGSLVCGYFNVTGGDYQNRRKVWSIRMKVGGETFTAKMTRLESGKGGYFTRSIVRKITSAAGNPDDSLMISLPYYKVGNVLIEFPLTGLGEALNESGIAQVEVKTQEVEMQEVRGWASESLATESLPASACAKGKTPFLTTPTGSPKAVIDRGECVTITSIEGEVAQVTRSNGETGWVRIGAFRKPAVFH